jgi:hypothetical protein
LVNNNIGADIRDIYLLKNEIKELRTEIKKMKESQESQETNE